MSILTLETKQYAIKIDKFEGPLDLLCHLIDANKMDIYDININDITDQYIKYLNEMEKMNLEIASEFLVMASTLLYLKSKKLLPKQENDEEELTEEELIQRIIDYKKYKEIKKKDCIVAIEKIQTACRVLDILIKLKGWLVLGNLIK